MKKLVSSLVLLVTVEAFVIAWLVRNRTDTGKVSTERATASVARNSFQSVGWVRPRAIPHTEGLLSSGAAQEIGRPVASLGRDGADLQFSYGTIEQAGAFLGATFRDQLESDAPSMVDLYSLGPIVGAAEAIESDPAVFAKFEAAMLGAFLELDANRVGQIESTLRRLKSDSLLYSPGTPEFDAFDRKGVHFIRQLLSAEELKLVERRFGLIEHAGVLMVSAYGILPRKT
jgi:hypothetical protein